MDRKKLMKTFRKLHKWPGVIITIFAIHFAFSGIIMNHRSLLSGVDLSRKWLPKSYEYKNWNQAAIRGGMTIGQDSLLIFGNIGTWIKTATEYLDHDIIYLNPTADTTYTLPTVASLSLAANTSKETLFVNISSYKVTIYPNGAGPDTIEGLTGIILTRLYSKTMLVASSEISNVYTIKG